MRVCWHYGSVVGSFVAEVGKLTLRAPNPMEDCRVSLTTKLKNTKAPMIISFKTASATTGARYTAAAGPTQVKFLFNDISTLEAYYSDFIASSISESTSEDEMVEAKQFICGRLFKELWSDDIDNGFPMPKGCYYKKYGTKRELFVLFEAKNGLRPGKNYQLVIHGEVKGAAAAGGKYLEIFAMDDVSINPYIAIEHGEAVLSTTPEGVSTSADSPKWMDPGGFKVMGGTNNIVTLKGADALRIEMSGDIMFEIKASSIVRVYLWPLTMWRTGSSCTANCVANDEVSFTMSLSDV